MYLGMGVAQKESSLGVKIGSCSSRNYGTIFHFNNRLKL